jgi:hypothetical protein
MKLKTALCSVLGGLYSDVSPRIGDMIFLAFEARKNVFTFQSDTWALLLLPLPLAQLQLQDCQATGFLRAHWIPAATGFLRAYWNCEATARFAPHVISLRAILRARLAAILAAVLATILAVF